MPPMRINLGGEGEIPDVLNQQGPWVVRPGWRSSLGGLTLYALVQAGHSFLIADNLNLPLPDAAYDVVITNNTPPEDGFTNLGPTVQTSEIQRILRTGGRWVHNGQVKWVKP
jgi:hypothetical protein